LNDKDTLSDLKAKVRGKIPIGYKPAIGKGKLSGKINIRKKLAKDYDPNPNAMAERLASKVILHRLKPELYGDTTAEELEDMILLEMDEGEFERKVSSRKDKPRPKIGKAKSPLASKYGIKGKGVKLSNGVPAMKQPKLKRAASMKVVPSSDSDMVETSLGETTDNSLMDTELDDTELNDTSLAESTEIERCYSEVSEDDDDGGDDVIEVSESGDNFE
jgi:hypothetical protein